MNSPQKIERSAAIKKMKSLNLLFAFILTIVTVKPLIPITVEATTYGTISGRVVDEITGKGVEGIIVAINMENRQIRTDQNGFFKFEKVPTDGEYEIRVFIDKEPYYTKTYELDIRMERRKNVILKDIVAKRGGAIEGIIKKLDGTPVSFMAITVYAEKELPGVYGCVPDKNGRYRVSKLPPDTELKVVAACWNVSRACGRIVKEGIRVERDKTTKGVDFIITGYPTQIYGKVVSKDGKPLRAHLTFWKDSEDMGNLLCDSEGNYFITGLEPGDYRIHVGYGSEKMKISGDKEVQVNKGDMIRIDIIISEESIEFKEYNDSSDICGTSNNPFSEENNEESLAELKFSQNDAFNEKLKDLILDAYKDDVMIKVKSNCLPDSHPQSVRMKMLDRLMDESNPIYIVIENENKARQMIHEGKLKTITPCGGSPTGSDLVYLYPAAFTEGCGSLESTLFHELMHVAGMNDHYTYASTKECYGDKAVDLPPYVKK